MYRGGFAGRGRRYADRTRVTCSKHTRSAAGLPATVCPYSPCPRRPAQVLLNPGNPSVGSRRDRRRPLLFRQQRPGGARRWPAATSFGGLVASASPAPRRFAHRTTDMAPMLRHADPCRASPCRPRCLLPALNRARPRSRALSSPGAKAAEAVPTPGMLSLESSSSFVVSLLLGDLPVQTPVAVGRPRCTG